MKVLLDCCKPNHNLKSEKRSVLEKLLKEVLEEKKLDNTYNPKWIDDQTLDTDTIPPIALHSFLLKVEQNGLSFTTERKVTVSFS